TSCLLPIAFALLGASTLRAQQSAFVIRLGRDTSAVERFTMTPTRIEGEGVVRQPRTTVRRFTIDLAADGRVTHAEVSTFAPGGTTPTVRQVLTVRSDSLIAETRRDTGAAQRRALVAPPGALVPQLGGSASSFLAFEVVAQRMKDHSATDDSVHFVTVN